MNKKDARNATTASDCNKDSEERLRRLVDILQHPSESIQEFLDYALKQAIELTESQIGYIYHYHEDRKEFVLNTWSVEVMKDCKVEKQETTYKLDKTGIWGEAVRQRRPIVINDYQERNPLKKGCPKGHVPLTNFLTVPIFKNKKIVGVVGLANKETDFDESDILNITLLMEAVWTVTESKKADQALLESNARYDKLVQRIPVGIYTMRIKTSGENQFEYCSERFCEMLGLTEEDVLNNPESVHGQIHPDDRAALDEANRKANLCLESFRWEGRSLIGGEIRWIRIESEPIFLANGDSLWNGVIFDISNQKKAKEELNQTSTRLTLATRAGRVGIWDWDIKSDKMLFDDLMLELYDLPAKNYWVEDKVWQKAIHPDDLEPLNKELNRAIQEKTEYNFEFRVVWRDASIHNIRALATVQYDDLGNAVRMIGTNWDITEAKESHAKTIETNRRLQDEIIERKYIEEALRSSEEKLKTIIETSPDGIAISSMDGMVEFVTAQSVAMWGYDSPDEIIGRNILEFIHESYHAKAIYFITEMINGNLTGAAEYLMVKKDGSLFYCETNANVLKDKNNKAIGVLHIERDITERKKLEEELKDLAIKDQLTGLYNRRKIDQVLMQEKDEADYLSVIMADIDMFKLVNDEYGHLVGDQVLMEIAAILTKGIRKTDILGRWGGEEFIIICTDTDLEGATVLAEKLRELVAAHYFIGVGKKTCSFGVAQLRKDETIDELLLRSDLALYQAKERGRNRVEQEMCRVNTIKK